MKLRLTLGTVFAANQDSCNPCAVQIDEPQIIAGIKRYRKPMIEYFYGTKGFSSNNPPQQLSLAFWVVGGSGCVSLVGDKNGIDADHNITDYTGENHIGFGAISKDPKQYLNCTIDDVENMVKMYCLSRLDYDDVEFI